MINFKNTHFVKSSPSYLEGPFDKDEIIIIGKSNVGKSSLINALTQNGSLAKTSSKPGHTKLLNYFNVDNSFYLVDAPGYGYTISGNKHSENFGKMMEEYFQNPKLKGIIFLLDSRHEMGEDDIIFADFLNQTNIPYVVVYTKIDKLNQKEKAMMKKRHINNFSTSINYIGVSAYKNIDIEKLKSLISFLLKTK